MSRRWPLVAFLCLAAASSLLTAAAPASEPAQGPPTAPPPTWTPGPAPEKTPIPGQEAATGGAAIELQVFPTSANEGIWTEVAWLDDHGVWLPVEGWHGPPDEFVGSEGRKRWWFATALGGQGPFRWAVRRGQGGPVLAVSEEFDLPYQGTRIIQINLGSHIPLLPESGGTSPWLPLILTGSGLVIVASVLVATQRRREA